MSRITKKLLRKKVVKTENNKVSIFPTLGIILALIASSVFHYYDNKGIIVNYILDKKEFGIALDAIKIVSFNFIIYNAVLLFLELFLYWKKKYKALYVLVGALILLTIWSATINFACVSIVSIIVGIYYIICSRKKES